MLPASAAVAAPAAPTGAAAGNQPAPAAQTNPIFGLLRMLAVWWLFRSFFSGGGGGGAKQSTSQLARSDYFLPLMQRATPIDVAMVLSEEKVLAPGWLAFGGGGGPESRTRAGDAARVVWTQSNVPLATAAESKVTVSYTPSEVSRDVDFLVPGHAAERFASAGSEDLSHRRRKRGAREGFLASMALKNHPLAEAIAIVFFFFFPR